MTKEKMLEIVAKYGMQELLNDEITKEQVGWYIVSDGPIDELESLVDCTDLVDIGFYVDRQYWEAGKRYYRMFAPKTWL